MPRNGAGTYSLPEPAFVPNTPISSSAMNSDLSDMASALTGSVAANGETTITGSLKGANGAVGTPAYSFASDLDTGLYRAGANNPAIAAGGSKILDITTLGATVTGALASTGTFVAADGTVLLPAYTFTNDLDCGIYRIGANNLGVAVNATKVLDISTTGLNVIGTILTNGAALAPIAAGAVMINGTIAESHAGNAVTFALKTLAGTDPSATDPVFFIFRNATAATGNYVVLQATGAMSLVISSGSTLGFTSGQAGRVWLAMFNDAGTLRMAAINCLASGINIYPLGQFALASSTAEGGAGGADSAHVFYTGTAVASKAYVPIAYASYESGLATAGSWDVSPTRLQLYVPSVPLPGQQIQAQQNFTGAVATGTTALPYDDTIPQNTEGDQYMTQAITPTSAANVLEIDWTAQLFQTSTGPGLAAALFQDTTANALAVNAQYEAGNTNQIITGLWAMIAGTTSSTTFKIRAGLAIGSTTTFNGETGSRKYGGAYQSHLRVREFMA